MWVAALWSVMLDILLVPTLEEDRTRTADRHSDTSVQKRTAVVQPGSVGKPYWHHTGGGGAAWWGFGLMLVLVEVQQVWMVVVVLLW